MSVFLLKLFFLALSSPLENTAFLEVKPSKLAETLPNLEAQKWRSMIAQLNLDGEAVLDSIRMERGGMFRDSIRIFFEAKQFGPSTNPLMIYEGDLLDYVYELESKEGRLE